MANGCPSEAVHQTGDLIPLLGMVLVWVGGDRSLSILPSPPHTLPTGVIQLGTPKCPCNTHSPQGSAGTHTCIPHTYIASSPPHCPLLSKPLTPRLTFILFSPKEALLNFDKQNSSWVKGCQVWDCHTAADREPVRGIALRREERTRGSVTCPIRSPGNLPIGHGCLVSPRPW